MTVDKNALQYVLKEYSGELSEYSKSYFKPTRYVLYIRSFRHLHYPVGYGSSCAVYHPVSS